MRKLTLSSNVVVGNAGGQTWHTWTTHLSRYPPIMSQLTSLTLVQANEDCESVELCMKSFASAVPSLTALELTNFTLDMTALAQAGDQAPLWSDLEKLSLACNRNLRDFTGSAEELFTRLPTSLRRVSFHLDSVTISLLSSLESSWPSSVYRLFVHDTWAEYGHIVALMSCFKSLGRLEISMHPLAPDVMPRIRRQFKNVEIVELPFQ